MRSLLPNKAPAWVVFSTAYSIQTSASLSSDCMCLLLFPVKDDLQPAKVLVTLKDTGFHKPESAMSVLTVCQRQLEAELLLVKEGMCLSPEDVGRVPAGMQVCRWP